MGESEQTVGLCARCVHARRVESRRGSVFWLCERSSFDARFGKYPQLPVLVCGGFENEPGTAEPS